MTELMELFRTLDRPTREKRVRRGYAILIAFAVGAIVLVAAIVAICSRFGMRGIAGVAAVGGLGFLALAVFQRRARWKYAYSAVTAFAAAYAFVSPSLLSAGVLAATIVAARAAERLVRSK